LRNNKSITHRTFKTKYMLKLSEVMTAKTTRLFVSTLTASGLIFTVAELATIQTAKAASYCECVGYVKRVIGIPDAAWTYSTAVNDLWTGRPDRRWYRIAGTQYWVASATVNGNAPGSQP
jgi:hypothetical protein